MSKESIVNPAQQLPLPSKEQIARRVEEMKANGVRGFIPLVQAIAKEYGDEAYDIAQRVFADLGFEVSQEQLRDPNEKGLVSYPWR